MDGLVLGFQRHTDLVGCFTSQSHVRSVVIVAPQPFSRLILQVFKRRKQVLVEQLITHGTVKAFDISILLRVARLGIPQQNATLFSPLFEVMADVLRPIVRAYDRRLAAPFNELIERTGHPLGR